MPDLLHRTRENTLVLNLGNEINVHHEKKWKLKYKKGFKLSPSKKQHIGNNVGECVEPSTAGMAIKWALWARPEWRRHLGAGGRRRRVRRASAVCEGWGRKNPGVGPIIAPHVVRPRPKKIEGIRRGESTLYGIALAACWHHVEHLGKGYEMRNES